MCTVSTSSFVQAGGALLAAALRDPGDILEGSTLWEFTQLTEAFCTQLSESERESPLYQQLVESILCIDEPMHTDITPIGDAFRFGSTLLEAFAAYVEQAVLVIAFLLDHRPTAQLAALFQQFKHVLSKVVQEIAEVPGQQPVQLALATFERCQAGVTNEERRQPYS